MVALLEADVKQSRKEAARKQHERILAHLDDVTGAQIGSAHAVSAIGGTFFLVENSRGLYDDENQLIEYKVTHSEFGWQCSCICGQAGFVNVHHKSGVCWHVRAAVALALEIGEAFGEVDKEEVSLDNLKSSNGIITDTGMLAWCADRAKGLPMIEQRMGLPAWMMR